MQTLVLDGQQYQLETRWNQRAQLWFLSLSDVDGTAVANSLPVVNSGAPINAVIYRQQNAPPGGLWAIAQSGQAVSAGADELGGRVVITYSEGL